MIKWVWFIDVNRQQAGWAVVCKLLIEIIFSFVLWKRKSIESSL